MLVWAIPAAKYAGTRHNVGFEVLDAARRTARLDGNRRRPTRSSRNGGAAAVLLAKPLTFMNLSGNAIGELLRFYKIDMPDLLVVVDDVNLELGRLRARPSGSAGGHNGLKSIIEQLGTEEFARLRVGVGRGDARRDLADHVLATFEPDERTGVAEAIRPRGGRRRDCSSRKASSR